MRFVDKHIEIEPMTRKPKKLTGTRFAAALGLNKWATPFQTWCEVTRTYEKPFEDTIYTIAGETIEPKQAEYVKEHYFMDNLLTPEQRYGKDYFKTTRGDFFPDEPIFGGMWDYLDMDDEITVLEMKTTKRAEDWLDDIPEYYALQAALYAHLIGTDNVCMVCSILEEKDYANPENFVPSAENTIVRPFKVSERYPDFAERIWEAEEWWKTYVEGLKSPDYDEKKDAEFITALRTKTVDKDAEMDFLLTEAEELMERIAAVKDTVKEAEERLKLLQGEIKERMLAGMDDNTDKAEISTDRTVWTLSKSERKEVDSARLKKDGIYNSYLTTKTTYTLRNKAKEN